ncbi:hypothetical protein ACE2AJ_13790 [Aquihabitans daechungensis]|uniref:hypothetical protein n=1 Tax=Aquihabitans daechungensis TaxID=1052257 RepID=UPI003B9ECC66
MTALPPAPPSAPAGTPPFDPAGWPTEPAKAEEAARLRSQVAVYVVCAVAIGIVSGASSTLEWGVATMLALAGGVAIALAADLHRPLGSIPGAAAAAVAMMGMTVLLAFVGGGVDGFALVPIVGAFVLGLDWRLVRRLRPLPFAFGFLVVIGVAGGDTWAYPAGLLWLVLALGALTSLEADRRAAQPKVQAVTAGPVAPDVEARDLLTTVLIALAFALVAALLLSTPSCQRSGEGGSGSGGFGQPGAGEFGSGEYGSGGTGSGSGEGGGGGGQGSGSGSASGHLYVPDPDGRYLIPNGEAGEGAGTGSGGVPSPELLPESRGTPRTYTLEDGTQITAERNADGTGRITVTDADGSERTYTYRERSDGLIEIQEFDDQGRPGRTLYYDPEGRLATDDGRAVDGSSEPTDPADEPEDEGESSHLDWRILALLIAVLAAAGAFVWWWSRRTPKAVAAPGAPPPWALRLAREIEREGSQRGPRRGRSQSLSRYADDLAAGPLPDPRLPPVADVVSTALFAREDPGPQAQQWAEATWAEILADHPEPDRAERRRAKAGATAR